MDPESRIIIIHLAGALLAGAVIGLERTYHGHSAGFRTHALVCMASSLLMLVPLYQWQWLPGVSMETFRTDPTRIAQGIMTGIGFLGAGAILKEGVTVRGLTTAASIWITAAIGILIGVGFYLPAVAATLLTLSILMVFRWVEAKLPSTSFAQSWIRFDRHDGMTEEQVRALLRGHGFSIANMSYTVSDDGRTFEYRMVIRTRHARNVSSLVQGLRTSDKVRAFQVSPAAD